MERWSYAFTRHRTGFLLVLLIFSVAAWTGCSNIGAPPEPAQDIVLSANNPLVKATMDIQDRHTEAMFRQPGVVGTATTLTEDGQPAIVVFMKSATLAKKALIPEVVDAVPVLTEITGEFRVLKGPPGGPPGGGDDPTARLDRPVPIGVSTGHPDITAGTIGCRVTSGSNVFALSNNHVYANENLANNGDDVIQPGTFDGGSSPADDIGTLSDYEPIVFSTSANNVMDAAIASTTTGNVGNATFSSSYGTPRSQTISPSVNMKVMKYGRTTEHTKGRISAINATVNVGYDTGVARFVNQIIITPGSFSAGGDSGSLIVVEKGQNSRRPVGLLFAGSSSQTIANPIDPVLTRFGVTVDGN